MKTLIVLPSYNEGQNINTLIEGAFFKYTHKNENLKDDFNFIL